MSRRFYPIALLALVFVAISVGDHAFAQTAVASTPTSPAGALTQAQPLGSSYVNLSPLVALIWQIVLAISGPLALVIFGSIFSFIRNKTGIALSQDAQQTVEGAFTNGVNLATSRLQSQFGGQLTIDVHNQLAATVVNYVIDHVPGALKQLGIDPAKNAENIAEKAIARLAGAGIVPPSNGQPLTVMPPAVPVAPGIGLVTGANAAPPSTAISNMTTR